MKLYIIVIISLLLGYSQSITAQVPGYQGKRFFVEIGGTFMPNIPFWIPGAYGMNGPEAWLISSPTAQNKGPGSFPFGNNTGHYIVADRYSLGIGYVLSRRHTFRAVYNYSVSGMRTNASTQSKSSSLFMDSHQLFYQLHMHDANLNISFTNLKKGGMAPLGFYFDLGLRFIFTQGVLRDQRVEYGDGSFTDYIPRSDYLNPLDIDPFTFMVGITGQYGYRAIFADRITFNVGLQFTLFPQHLLANADGALSPFPGNAAETYSNYDISVINTVAGRYFLGFHIGVGALIF